MSCCFFFIFFFQAEDGIRDHCVTGVQTCAPSDLRSSLRWWDRREDLAGELGQSYEILQTRLGRLVTQRQTGQFEEASGVRSEERRVGKECRSGWSPDDEKEKKGGGA